MISGFAVIYHTIYFYTIIILYALTSAFGLVKIKMAQKLLSMDFMLGFFLYGAGFVVWLFILRKFPLSIAFPVAAGSLIIATQIFAYSLLHEEITLLQVVGAALIISGIVVVHIK